VELNHAFPHSSDNHSPDYSWPMKEAIRQRALELGFDDCRFTSAAAPESAAHLQDWLAAGKQGEMAWLARNAERRTDPQRVLPGAKSVICLVISYEGTSSGLRVASSNQSSSTASLTHHVPRTTHHGVVARYARYPDYHDILAEKLKQLTACVNELGEAETRSLWYVDTGPILERDLAQRAGLGFVGKHTNLISRKLGNWIFLAEILTTLELEPDAAEKNRCGTCSRCITACPTRAITAPFQLDARLCISYLTIELKGAIPIELRPLIGNRIYGCDDCLAACPWNKFAQAGGLMQPHAREDLATPDLIELLQLDDAGFKQKFADTPLLRTKRRGVLRNVCVALGNVGDETALPALQKACEDAEPLIAEHAQWAIRQIEFRR
jgi:epoxyqueuosine reductase